jgi:hypothetical protein
VAVTIRAVDVELPPVEAVVNLVEYDVVKSVPWQTARDSEEDSPAVEFTVALPRALGLVLEVDDGVDLPKLAERLQGLARQDDKLRRPPMVTVVWGPNGGGGLPAFKGVIESIGTKYTMFSSDGSPLRAVVSIKMREGQRAAVRTCETAEDCGEGQTCVDGLCRPR